MRPTARASTTIVFAFAVAVVTASHAPPTRASEPRTADAGAALFRGAGEADAAEGAPPDSASSILDDISGAVADQGALAPVDAHAPGPVQSEIPVRGSEPAEVVSPAGTLTMTVPAKGHDLASASKSTALFEGADEDTTVAVQRTVAGVRALIHIDSSDAPEWFDFPIGGDVALLRLTGDGGVEALGAEGLVIAAAPAPWAMDADGAAVPTHYEVEGMTLVQVVEHRSGDYAYGIVADPFWSAIGAALKKAVSTVAGATKSASRWLGSQSKWLAGKAWRASKTTVKIGGKSVRVLAKKAGPLGLVLCATGAGWAWYRSDSSGWVRAGDTVAGCFL